MDFLKASVEEVAAYFMERWGRPGGYTQTSEHDLRTFDLSASARSTPVWQQAVIDIAMRELNETKSTRARLSKAIMVAVERGVEVPLSVQQAMPVSTDPGFKNLENQYHSIKRDIELFPDIGPYRPHDLRMLCDAIVVGRFDIAAQIFVSAENKTKKVWIRKLHLL